MRELHKLKQLTDYSCIDPTNLNSFLQSIGPEFSVYTYCMLNAGFDSESIRLNFFVIIVFQEKFILKMLYRFI